MTFQKKESECAAVIIKKIFIEAQGRPAKFQQFGHHFLQKGSFCSEPVLYTVIIIAENACDCESKRIIW